VTLVAPQDVAVRGAIEELYLDYVDALDEDRLEAWPQLFIAESRYRVVSRENVERGWPLATMSCDSRASMCDRVYAIRNTAMYVPRRLRHIVSALRVRSSGDAFAVTANFAVFETLPDHEPRVFSVGRYQDTVVATDEGLRFRDKLCVYDSDLIPNSLLLPL
jgi:salicylate 5-hydroxylase small subunit